MNYTKTALIAGAMAIATTIHAQTPTAEDVVKKHNSAIGGTEKWNNIQSYKSTTHAVIEGQTMQVVLSVLKDKGARQDVTVGGHKGFVIITPEGGWSGQPGKPAKTLSQNDMKYAAAGMAYKDKLMEVSGSYTFTLGGKETINGKSCYKLKAVSQSQDEEHIFYIDAINFYMVRDVVKTRMDDNEHTDTINYSNFKKLPEGIVVAMKTSTKQGDLITDKVEINTIKSDAILKP